MTRQSSLSDYDIFAQPVSLRYKGDTHFKNSCGGLLTICYLIVCAFLACVMSKALIVGKYLNSSATTYNLLQSNEGFLNPMNVIDSNFRFGFFTPPSLLSGSSEVW